MGGSKNIMSWGSGGKSDEPETQSDDADAPGEIAMGHEADTGDDWEDDLAEMVEPTSDRSWIAASLALLAIAAWTAFFVYAHFDAMQLGAGPAQWSEWISAWAPPVLVATALWLVALRLSRHEAARFKDAAQALAVEAERLENRLHTVNRELSLARDFIAAQSRDLESLGRLASERLSTNAETLAGLITDNGERIDSIAGVSTRALENMSKLRDELPVVANSARDVANQIGSAGNNAHEQLDQLVAGFERLNQFGQASEVQVEHLCGIVDGALSDFEARQRQHDEDARARMTALREQSEQLRVELDDHANATMGTLRRQSEAFSMQLSDARSELADVEDKAYARMRDQAEAMKADLAASRAEIELVEDVALAKLRDKVQAFNAELAQAQGGISQVEDEAADSLRQRLDEIMRLGNEASGRFDQDQDAAVTALQARLAGLETLSQELTEQVRAGEQQAAERWAEAIKQLEDDLQGALERIAQIDAGAIGNAKRRLEALFREAERLDQATDERQRKFYATLAEKAAETEAERDRQETELEERLAALDGRIAGRHATHLENMSELDRRGEELALRLTELGAHMQQLSNQGSDAGTEMSDALERLSTLLGDSRRSLGETHQAIEALTDASIRLLEIIQAGSKHSRTDLPEAIGVAEERLAGIEERTGSLGLIMSEASDKARSLSDYVLAATDASSTSLRDLEQIYAAIDQHGASQKQNLDSLNIALTALAESSEALSERTQGELRTAIVALQEAAREVLDELETNSSTVVQALAERIGEESGAAIDKSLKLHSVEAIGQMEQAAAHASGVGREAAIQLRDQLAKVAELTDHLEARVAQARERAQEQVDNDFSRRMALITESLNSNAIDIAKSLSEDVSDTAWKSYLRGDRGIFTRRAVRLIDNGTAREIAEIYEADHDFREHVSRYIHDFEAMLRSMLSTRDGNALAVTLLSSDMGKLYVALAQAIERLRS